MFVKQIGPFFCLYLFSALLNGRQRVPITDIKYTINSVANWQTVINFALNHDLLQKQRKKESCAFLMKKGHHQHRLTGGVHMLW